MVAVLPASGHESLQAVFTIACQLASRGKRILVLDELWQAGEPHPIFGMTPRNDLGMVLVQHEELENALVKTAEGIDFLAGASASHMPRPKMESRIGLVNAFYRLAGQYDAVLINACVDAANSRPSFAWACQDVIVLSEDNPDSMTDVYARIKLLHQSDKRRFHLMFCATDTERAAALYRSIAAVSRRHLHVMPEYQGVLPSVSEDRTRFLRNLAETIESWPMPEHKAGHFPDLMRRLLRGADPHVLQSLLK